MKTYTVYVEQITTSTKAFTVRAEDVESAVEAALELVAFTPWDDEQENTDWEAREDLVEEN